MRVLFEPSESVQVRRPDRTGGGAAARIAPVAIALAVLAGQVYLAVSRHFAAILETPFLPYCLLGAFAIHFWTRPAYLERLSTAVLAAAGIALFAAEGGYRFDWPTSIACCAFLGLASLAVLAVQVVRLRGAEQKSKLDTLIAGSIFGYSALFITFLLNFTTRAHPRTYDLYLYAADAGLRLPICAWIGRLVNGTAPLLHTCSIAYESLPLWVSLLYACQRSGSRPVPVHVLPAFIGGGAAAYALYNFLPATGPRYLFGPAFPDRLPAAALPHLVTIGETARNAVPSMHMACALLLFWCCRRMPAWVRAAAGVFLLLTLLATIGFGEHYVVDLVAGVPYALALLGICGVPRRSGLSALGISLTLAWMLALRFAISWFAFPVFVWTAAVVTVVLCCRAANSALRVSL